MAYWYFVKTQKYDLFEKLIHENTRGERTVVEENRIIRTSALPPRYEDLVTWSAAYTSDEEYALVRAEEKLPEGLYEKELKSEEDFLSVYDELPELRDRFTDQPYR